jgi:hypothetical protein
MGDLLGCFIDAILLLFPPHQNADCAVTVVAVGRIFARHNNLENSKVPLVLFAIDSVSGPT